MEPLGGECEDCIGHGRFADPAEGKASYGDSELNGREKLIDAVLELKRRARAGTPQSDELLDARLANTDEGELGSDEEATGQNEEGHHHYAEKHPLKHPCQCNGSCHSAEVQSHDHKIG